MSRFILLSRTYGYTPEQVRQLTVKQASEYLSAVVVEKNDPAVRYEPIDYESPEEIKFRERLNRERQKLREQQQQKKKQKHGK